MKTIKNLLGISLITGLILFPIQATAQTDAKAAQLKTLETSLANAKARVALQEKKIAAADSTVNAGTQLIKSSKTELKAVDAESKKLEKDYAAKQKPLQKLTASKDKAEAAKARADIKALDTQYKIDNKALETRLREATKKQTTGASAIERGKTAKKNAQDGLKAATAALKTAQAKYDAATAPAEDKNSKGKGKK